MKKKKTLLPITFNVPAFMNGELFLGKNKCPPFLPPLIFFLTKHNDKTTSHSKSPFFQGCGYAILTIT